MHPAHVSFAKAAIESPARRANLPALRSTLRSLQGKVPELAIDDAFTQAVSRYPQLAWAIAVEEPTPTYQQRKLVSWRSEEF